MKKYKVLEYQFYSGKFNNLIKSTLTITELRARIFELSDLERRGIIDLTYDIIEDELCHIQVYF